MSKQGIKIAADVFYAMQRAREALMRLGTERDLVDKQDIALSQLMERGKDAMKEDFAKITMEKA